MSAGPSGDVDENHPCAETQTPNRETVIPPSLLHYSGIGMGVSLLNMDISRFNDGFVDHYDAEEEEHEVADADSGPIICSRIEWETDCVRVG